MPTPDETGPPAGAPRNADGGIPHRLENVRATPADEMDAELAKLLDEHVLSEDRVLASLFDVTKAAQQMASEAVNGLTAQDFDAKVAGSAGLEAALVQAELQGSLARFGLKPLNSVEGLIALRAALVQAFKDNKLVPVETRLKALQLETEIGKVEAVRSLSIQIAVSEAEKAQAIATAEARVAEIKASTSTQLAKMAAPVELKNAMAGAAEADLAADRRLQTVKIDRRNMRRAGRVEFLGKLFLLQKKLRHTIAHGLVRPALRWALIVLVPLVLVANLVADDPARKDTPVLGTVNNTWDRAYAPVKDGVVRVFHHYKK